MLKYTICFIKQGSKILLINRERPSWMGMWNGIGGKIEPGESPRASMIREIMEETGLSVPDPEFKGVVTWFVDGRDVGGMYAYFVELPEQMAYETPIKTDEGILDWKELDWILNPDNNGIARNVPKFLPSLIFEDAVYEHQCVFRDGKLEAQHSVRVTREYELLENKARVEQEISGRYFAADPGLHSIMR